MSKKYKCPYCENRLERNKLIIHVSKNHGELIPHGMFPEQVVFNSINKTNGGKCRVCGKSTSWNQKAGRYDVLCGNPQCKEKMREDYKRNMLRVRGTYNILNDPGQQEKMLANRSISGKYKFQDGGEVSYTGSYEKKCLEFMDIVMQIPSKDILSPGPTMEYEYNGGKHIYIPDFYYIPYNLIIEVKDGGKNPNRKSSIGMDSSREKTIEKERLVTDRGEYNYIRLTDNDFAQLITIFMQIKYKLLTGDFSKTININESEIIQESLKTDKYYRVSVNGIGIYQALKMKVGRYDFKEIIKSPDIKWLPTPSFPYYYYNYSFFTNYGFTVFKQRTLPIMLKYFKPEEIKIEENIGYPGKLVYKDRFQIIVEIDRDSISEACKNVATARKFVSDVAKLAKKYDANYFIVTDGASGTSNNGNPAVKHAREAQIQWERENGFDPDEDWSKDDLKSILAFNKQLNTYDYGIMYNKKFHYGNQDDFVKYYRVLSPEKFDKYKCGVCWDFVIYEANYFNTYFKNIKYNAYFVCLDEGKMYPTHTFIIFEFNNKYYWFESSWRPHQGVHQFRSEKEALNTIIKELINDAINKDHIKYIFVCKYDPINPKTYGMTSMQYMDYMLSKPDMKFKYKS